MAIISKKLKVNLILLSYLFFYYNFFATRGMVINDPGYYYHIVERILSGETPYVDFFIQFPPGYFYILAFVFKIFGLSMIVGRYFALFLCLAIGFLVLKIMDNLNISSIKIKILAIFSLAAFGYPLINNIAMIAWISVLNSLLMIYLFIKWYTGKGNKRLWLLLIALSMSLSIFLKQNLGLYFFVLMNIMLFLSSKEKFLKRIKNLLFVDIIIGLLTVSWVYFFFLRHNISYLYELMVFSKRYISIYPFTYPPLSMLFQPLGVFKLLPYYLPIVFFLLVIISIFKKKKYWTHIVFSLVPLVGFAGTIYPTSDLLHVYPFFGLILVSFLVYFYKTRKLHSILIIIICILIGFYLTFFKGYYRYGLPYKYFDHLIDLPKTKSILVNREFAENTEAVYSYLEKYTDEDSEVLIYPFAETLYFILERDNPSRFSIYYPGYRSYDEEVKIINKLKIKNVKYVVTSGEYRYNTPLSKFIQQQKIVFSKGQYRIFLLK